MRPRIIIFSPYITTREDIGYMACDYMKKNFKTYLKFIDFQRFSSINDSIEKMKKVGEKGKEILVIFDQAIAPSNLKQKGKMENWAEKERLRYKGLKALAKITKDICDTQQIPYIIYEGEIERGKRGLLERKLSEKQNEISRRIHSV